MKCIHLFFLVIVLGDKACWLKYLKEINESDGFDITDFPGCGPLTTIFPMTPSKETKKFAEQALELYNEDNVCVLYSHCTEYKVNEILKVNGCFTQYFHSYITFTVTNGEHEYFQAEVRKDVDGSLECAIIRPRVMKPALHPFLFAGMDWRSCRSTNLYPIMNAHFCFVKFI
ncbi:uncharacterized protein LOC107869993 [Capsicum annuum]|uniref:uncharacterized protein LOC107869993 n=1 Tax=Capsicum annuum TaxID=4072 RepID=UPI001FB19C67|nr:uncharacterized protein LOC107869993 [Capsicum annuum]